MFYYFTYIIIVNKYIFLMYSIAKSNIECVPMRNEEVYTLYLFFALVSILKIVSHFQKNYLFSFLLKYFYFFTFFHKSIIRDKKSKSKGFIPFFQKKL